jgi:xanthine dehydrogenase YagS FAD-binding subunit
MGGGQDLLGVMKDYIRPVDRVVDLKRIAALKGISYDAKKGLRIGALVTLSEIEQHPIARRQFPAIAEAARSIGSPQIRNVGTLGGNLCQRPRCWYFRNEHVRCLKKGGDKCFAAPDDAENKYHAILGGGPCHIVHPSDLAPALIALGATVSVTGGTAGPRIVPLAEFFTLPSEGSILHETVLKQGEIVTETVVPVTQFASRSTYIKCRERESFDWALSSVAIALDVSGTTIRDVRIVLGGVAPTPWRAKAAEAALRGKSVTDVVAIEAAAKAATVKAEPLAQNEYKVALTQALVRRAAKMVAAGPRVAFETGDGGEPWTA